MKIPFKEKKPQVWSFRYERDDGNFRTIDVRADSRAEAEEIAERRLSEQFGDMAFHLESQRQQIDPDHIDPGANLLRNHPDLHQSNYALVSVERVR